MARPAFSDLGRVGVFIRSSSSKSGARAGSVSSVF